MAFPIERLPAEVIGLVLANLVDQLGDVRASGSRTVIDGLCSARLVCRQWNALAFPLVFQTVSLVHDYVDIDTDISDESPEDGFFEEESDEEDPKYVDQFPVWEAMMDCETIRDVVRRVVIHTAPEYVNNGEEHEGQVWETWDQWTEHGKWHSFENSIKRIKELPHLTEVTIKFSNQCRGEEAEQNHWQSNPEPRKSRLHSLKAVFTAILERAKDASFSKISALTLWNLQNAPIPEFTESKIFKDVMQDVQKLAVKFIEEDNEHGPDNDLYLSERKEFEPYFAKHWLAPFAHQFTSLSLGASQEWGTAPGYFTGAGLNFPNLETLYLRQFTVSHDDHLDWVLAQKSSKSLRFDTVWIAKNFKFSAEDLSGWQCPTHDWVSLSHDLPGFETYYYNHFFLYNGKWADFFDKIRIQLPNLTDFRFATLQWGASNMLHQNLMQTKLVVDRYTVFDSGTIPPWLNTRGDGEIESAFNADGAGAGINFAKENEAEDKEALDRLLETTLARALGKETPMYNKE